MTSQDELVLKLQQANAEIESLRQLQEDQESSMQHEITKLADERDELREQIKGQDRAYSDLSQLCNLKIGELSAVLQKASECDYERDEWKRKAIHLRDWVKMMHGLYGEGGEIDLESEYLEHFPEAREWFEGE